MMSIGSKGVPWEALFLVGQYLDPKSLAAASGVSKSWLMCLSSDHLWEAHCSAAFPSLEPHHGAARSVSYRRLYALGHTAAGRRIRKLPSPALSLDSLLFAVNIETPNGHSKSLLKPPMDPFQGAIFRFDLHVDDPEVWRGDVLDEFRVTWHVVLRGWEAVFCVMDCKGKAARGLLSEELPSPGCCASRTAGSALVADMAVRVRSRGEGQMVVENVTVGLLSMCSWSYVTVHDALPYLQHFLSDI